MNKESIAAIKEKYKAAEGSQLQTFIDTYGQDSRSGVRKLTESAGRRLAAWKKELGRIDAMLQIERGCAAQYSVICGVDEAGRGPLAGPVVAGAVILNPDDPILYVNDSKQLSPAMREKLYTQITERAVSWAAGCADHEEIDRINILQADYQAMRRAVAKLSPQPDLLLNDVVVIPDLPVQQISLIKGDARCLSIAAASIVAKVTRDRMMMEYDKMYPEYHFAQNKGYGTAEHIEAIRKYGPCPIHRRSFISHFWKES